MFNIRCAVFGVFAGGGFIFSMLILILLLSSCEEESAEPSGNISDQQYIGTWSGHTNEGLLVTIKIDTVNRWTWVKRVLVNYYGDSTKQSLYKEHIDGLAKVVDGSFSIDLGDGNNFSGEFINSNLLVGTFLAEGVEGFYSSTNEADEANINSVSQVQYTFKNNSYYFRQDNYDTITRYEYTETHNHLKSFSSSLKIRPPIDDSVRLIKITKGRLSNLWSEDAFVQFFGPGKRNYSNGGRNGIEIVLHDAEDNFKRWTTSLDTANQQDSYFEIVEAVKLENNLQDKVIVKLIARFECMMYDGKGNQERLSDGKFIGLFGHELEK